MDGSGRLRVDVLRLTPQACPLPKTIGTLPHSHTGSSPAKGTIGEFADSVNLGVQKLMVMFAWQPATCRTFQHIMSMT